MGSPNVNHGGRGCRGQAGQDPCFLGCLRLGTGKQPLCEEFGGGSRAGREPGSATHSSSPHSVGVVREGLPVCGKRAAAARGTVMPLSLARDKGARVAGRTAAPSRGPDSGKHRNPVINPVS